MPSVFLKSDTSVTANTGTIDIPKPEAHVYFRPHTGFDGEFGIDWMRMGDTSQNGDTEWYRDILLATSKGSYSDLVGRYDSFKHPTRDGDKYLIPVVNLLKGKSAKFSLKVDVKKEPVKLSLKYDTSFFKIKPEEITEKTLGKRSLKDYLEIKCINELTSDTNIDVMADDELAGRIKFMANDKGHRYIANVVFVYVVTNLQGKLLPRIPVAPGCSGQLKKYLNQALVEPKFKYELLNLSSDGKINSKYSKNGVIVDGVNPKTNKDYTEELLEHVNSKFEENDKADTYKDYHKVYFISEDAQGLYGRALDIPSKSAVVFEVGFGDSTVSHELLHAMGLYHSFDDDGDFAMEYHLTDNIMDYSDMDESPLPLINVVSTWLWQWPIIRKNVNKEE